MRSDRLGFRGPAALAAVLALAVGSAVPAIQAAPPAGELSDTPLGARIQRATADTSGAVWVRYTVERVLGDGFGRNCRSLLLFDDEARGSWTQEDDDGGVARLARPLAVFVGWRDGLARALRVATIDCLPRARQGELRELGPVEAGDSVAFLAAWADRADDDPGARSRDEALAALAQHDDPAADAALERRARQDGHPLRREAVFWLGAARGVAGLAAIERLLESGGPPPDLREHVAFALTLIDAPGAVERLAAMARRDPDADVRKQALFWLGQEAGERAVAELIHAVDDDPDRGVKEAAVFALSQLPPDEGVPLLIGIAGTHADPHVREQAFFWLGQSGTPEALAFFERVLSGDDG